MFNLIKVLIQRPNLSSQNGVQCKFSYAYDKYVVILIKFELPWDA